MALVDNAWYVNYGDGSAGAGKKSYWDVAQWAALTVYAAGALIRQLAAPAVGSERVFVCVVAGTSLASEPTFTLTRGAKTAEAAGPTWQECTGIAALNGDVTNTPSWTISATPPGGVKNTSVTLGQVIKRDSAASYQICTTAGTAGNGAEPSFSDTAGTTTSDNTVTWTSLGVVGNFGVLAAPHARLQAAFAANWGQTNNSFFLGDNHAETQSSNMTLTSPAGTAGTGIAFVYSFNHSGSVPPTSPTSGASISTTAAATLTFLRSQYYRGVTFNFGSGANSSSVNFNVDQCQYVFTDCAFAKLATNSNAGAYTIGGSGNSCEIIFGNTTVKFGNTGDSIKLLSSFIWTATPSAIQGATIPTTLFNPSAFIGTSVSVLDGVDISALGSGAILGSSAQSGIFRMNECKLGSSWPLPSLASFSNAGLIFDAVNCDSGATNYFNARATTKGSHVQETTIVRTSGATDGTTPVSLKIVTTALSKWVSPFISQPITIWNDSTSSVTVTMYGIWGGGAVPNNDDIWMLVEYLGSNSSPLGSFATTTKASNLATGSAHTSDSSTWGGSTTPFKMSATFTPQQKGPFTITIKAAKISSTFYIDPKPEISGVTVSKSEVLAPGVYTNELSSGTSGGFIIGG